MLASDVLSVQVAWSFVWWGVFYENCDGRGHSHGRLEGKTT